MAESSTPPWVWTDLTPDRLARNWQELAAWVAWLEDAYAPWVLLPACWPDHEGLRTELTMYWYWHRWVQRKAANPIDGVRFHQELRRSAQAWRELSNCRHDPPMPHRQQIRAGERQRRDQFIQQVMASQLAARPAAASPTENSPDSRSSPGNVRS